MKKVAFGTLVKLLKGKKHNPSIQRSTTSKRFIQIDDLRNDKLVKFTDDKSGVEAHQNDLLIAWDGANAGTVGWGLNGYVGSTIVLIRLKEPDQWHTPFLGFFLRSQFNTLRANTTGATIPHLSRISLDNLQVPDISLDAQRQIAHILSRAEELIAARQQTLALLDDFLKSTFFDMFGDPVNNKKGWKVEKLEKCLTRIDSGWSPVCLDEVKQSDEEWAILKLGAVTSRYFKSNENKKLPDSLRPRPNIEVRKNDLLFSRKNTRELVGACAYVFDTPPGLMLSDTIFRLVHDQNVRGQYLWYLLNGSKFRKSVQALASGSAGSMPNISKERLANLKIPLPSLDLQSQFAEIVNRVEALKAQQRESLTELKHLYQSLMQRAFAGQLDVSRVVLPALPTAESPKPKRTERPNTSLKPDSDNLPAQLPLGWDFPNAWQQPPMQREQSPASTLDNLILKHGQGLRILYSPVPATDGIRDLVLIPAHEPERPVPTLDTLTTVLSQAGPVPFEMLRRELGTVAYTNLKRLIFEGLEQGEIYQEFDDETNTAADSLTQGRILLTVTPTPIT
ncbi:restriction endonuclease subunit S [Spirosoma montaniterrae]|uniref:Type I restriction modification DNA specificity domain-containing protein n=1 Tax=Spirosoma montaniterrae TaxID=1178516 RepID=A0A1P9WZ17_9BACT|nr:restriction endonuclease subunit S [Spirosoma montaniterrae]AQG80594.1 hypothetical protein AWR27_15455 [Spirosoma montaniterrae]